MNMESLLQLGAKVFAQSDLSGEAGSGLNTESLASALSDLTDGSGGLDFGALVNNFSSGGLGEIVNSWLGDGDNQTVSADQITNVIGDERIADFARKLGLSRDEAAGGLSEALPQMVDKASSGGSLLESVGGIEGAIGIAKKLFGN